MANRIPEGFGLEDRRNRPEVAYEFIRISDAELRHFEKVETLTLERITPKGTPIPECFLFAEFTRTPACGEAVLGTLGQFA